MYGKILISGEIEILTGMHIGSSDSFSAIGAVDAPVIRDSMSGLPIIPGSSIKGKLRTLLAREFTNDIKLPVANNDAEEVRRLFGANVDNKVQIGRLIFRDCSLINEKNLNYATTEVKFENTINRTTGVANPRQIERVVKGSIFDFSVVYDIHNETEIIDDFSNIALALQMLQLDYLGGHGTRGYGKVQFNNLKAECVGRKQIDSAIMQKINEILEGVRA